MDLLNLRYITYMLAACSQAHFAARSTAKMKSHPALAVCLFNTVNLQLPIISVSCHLHPHPEVASNCGDKGPTFNMVIDERVDAAVTV